MKGENIMGEYSRISQLIVEQENLLEEYKQLLEQDLDKDLREYYDTCCLECEYSIQELKGALLKLCAEDGISTCDDLQDILDGDISRATGF